MPARPAAHGVRSAVAGLAREPRFEVIPLPGTEDAVAEHVPPQATVTVTASPRRGLADTLDLTTRLALRGFHTVPHLAARMVADETDLAAILRDLTAAGVREVFVVAGDREEPAGDFTGALDLLQAMERIGHEFTVGIAGYPESHPEIPDNVTVRAMADKQFYASYIVSQMCFDSRVILNWVRRVRRRGVQLPIRVGVAGPVSTARLLRIGTRLGIGPSLRVLSHHRGGLRHLALPGAWRPEKLLQGLAPAFADPAYGLDGLHVYTFNAVADTVRWWQGLGSEQAPSTTEMTR